MTEFTEEKLAELRAVAEAAALDFRWFDSVVIGDLLAGYTGRVEESDASEHIATFDPPTALALIAALEAKTADAVQWEAACTSQDGALTMQINEAVEWGRERERERGEARELYKGACEAEDALNSVNDALIRRVEKAEAALERVKGTFFKNRLYLMMMSYPAFNNPAGEALHDKIDKLIQQTIEGTNA